MARYQLTAPDGTSWEVNAPDDAPEAEVLAYAQKSWSAPQKEPAAPNVTDQGGSLQFGPWDTGVALSPTVTNALAGVGQGMTNLARGAGQKLGLISQDEIKRAADLDKPLLNTTAGKVGSIVGQVATALPTTFVPGANTYTGAALVGATTGALQPVAEGSVIAGTLKDTALGAGAGVAGQAAGQGLGWLARQYNVRRAATQAARQAANAEKDATLTSAQQAGYVVPPAMTEGNMTGKVLSGLSGKAKTEQLARVRNQRVTDSLARRALNLPNDVPITQDVTQAVRQAAYTNGYQPVSQVGNIATDADFANALNRITNQYAGASRSFPQATQNQIAEIIDQYRVPQFLAEDGITQIQVLRDMASDAYRAGNGQQGRALREISRSLEDQIERHLTGLGQDGAGLLRNFRDARQLMARSHTVEDAIREGSGSVDAAKFAAALQKGAPLTGELETIGRFANNFREAARMPGGADANPLTVLDWASGAYGAGSVNPLLMALPAARVGARYGILSQAGQRAFTAPNYGQSLLGNGLGLLDTDTANALARILPPSVYTTQQ